MNSVVADTHSKTRSVKVHEGPPKTAFVSENIDAVRELIMQYRDVTYRQTEAFLGISSTNIHSILHEQLVIKRLVLAASRNRLKKALVDWCIEMLEKYDGSASQNVYKIVTGMRMRPKQNNSPPYGPSKTSQIQRKLLVKKSLRSKCWPVSSAKLVMWRLFHLRIVGRSILSGTPSFV